MLHKVKLDNFVESLICIPQRLLDDKSICDPDVRVPVEPRAGRGVGVVEAPRGSLIHDYSTDDNGLITASKPKSQVAPAPRRCCEQYERLRYCLHSFSLRHIQIISVPLSGVVWLFSFGKFGCGFVYVAS
jgi:hypothetical protein